MRREFQNKPKQQLVWLSCALHLPHARHAHFRKVLAKVPPLVIPAGNLLSLRVWTGQERPQPSLTLPPCYFSQPCSHNWSQSATLVDLNLCLYCLFCLWWIYRKATVSWRNHKPASVWTWCLIVRFNTEKKTCEKLLEHRWSLLLNLTKPRRCWHAPLIESSLSNTGPHFPRGRWRRKEPRKTRHLEWSGGTDDEYGSAPMSCCSRHRPAWKSEPPGLFTCIYVRVSKQELSTNYCPGGLQTWRQPPRPPVERLCQSDHLAQQVTQAGRDTRPSALVQRFHWPQHHLYRPTRPSASMKGRQSSVYNQQSHQLSQNRCLLGQERSQKTLSSLFVCQGCVPEKSEYWRNPIYKIEN